MRGSAVEIEVVFLHIFAVIALVAGEPKDPFFQDRIPFVPQRQRKADELTPVADSSEAIFIPAVRARAGMVMGEEFPGIPVGAVVFTHCTPGALAEIGPPTLPVFRFRPGFRQSDFFLCHGTSSQIMLTKHSNSSLNASPDC